MVGALDVHFINTLPVLAASCHSRESGNPGDEGHGDWARLRGHDVLLASDLRNRHLAGEYDGLIQCCERLGGLLKYYEREAA